MTPIQKTINDFYTYPFTSNFTTTSITGANGRTPSTYFTYPFETYVYPSVKTYYGDWLGFTSPPASKPDHCVLCLRWFPELLPNLTNGTLICPVCSSCSPPTVSIFNPMDGTFSEGLSKRKSETINGDIGGEMSEPRVQTIDITGTPLNPSADTPMLSWNEERGEWLPIAVVEFQDISP